jgi:tetratricopeptide (TPR) repeat protein
MTKPETEETPAEGVAAAQAEAEPEAPAPEPWTAERVAEWNRYYDLYVAAAVLFLVALGAAHKILTSSLWPTLQAGRLATARGWPMLTDLFSFTRLDKPWVNIPWLFGWLNSLIYDLGRGLTRAPIRPADAATASRPDQVAAGLLVAVNIAVRTLTALVLLGLRRPGPGLWWVAICVALALGGMIVPAPSGVGPPVAASLGGVAGIPDVEPTSWGLLLLALELAFLHQAINLGRPRALAALVPLFLAWANVDESFLMGLLVLAATAVGRLADRPAAKQPGPEPGAPSFGRLMAWLGACAAACLVNPSLWRVYPAALSPFLALFQSGPEMTLDQLSFFGRESGAFYDRMAPNARWIFIGYYVVVVAAVLASFVLNRRNFRLARFLPLAIVAVLWAALRRLDGEFALVGAATLALNGQEWYHDRYGVQGRLGAGWAAWSVGGRALTLIAVFLLVVKGLTGYGTAGEAIPLGLGVNPDDFPFEAADYLKTAPFRGNVLNLDLAEGDALIWRAWPENPATWAQNPGRRTFIDSRRHLFPDSLRAELRELRRALAEDDATVWVQALDRYQVSAVLLSIARHPGVYGGLQRSPNWIEFYDDGTSVLFGRVDEGSPGFEALKADQGFFRQNPLNADALVYKRRINVPSVSQTPTPVSWLDSFFRTRALTTTQPHVKAADRWLHFRWGDSTSPPDPAHCLMAIREARTALAHNPDDTDAFRILNLAYFFLSTREQALVQGAGADPTPIALFRYRQRAAALNSAIRTTPPPTNEAARHELGSLHMQLAEMYRSLNYLDLERDQLELGSDFIRGDDFPAAERERLAQLNERLDEAQRQLQDFAAEQQASPLQLANRAMAMGMPGYAIAKLEQAEEQGMNLATVKWQLVDLYTQVGLPDKTFELVTNLDDPGLYTGPGTPAHRQATDSFLIGDYTHAKDLWRRALSQLRGTEAMQAMAAARSLIQGEAKGATATFREVPGLVNEEATWEYELGLCLLEAGNPEIEGDTTDAGDHMAKALQLQPRLSIRPLLEYYLKKLDKPIPPVPEGELAKPADGPAKPKLPGPVPELPADVFDKKK